MNYGIEFTHLPAANTTKGTAGEAADHILATLGASIDKTRDQIIAGITTGDGKGPDLDECKWGYTYGQNHETVRIVEIP